MTYILPVGVNKPNASYNAVKIQVNNPQTNLPEEFKGAPDGVFNAVNIEVNDPSVNIRKQPPAYEYPVCDRVVTYDLIACPNCEIPAIPVAYQTNLYNFDTEIEFECDCDECKAKKEDANNVEEIEENTTSIPEPNITTTEAEKAANISFNGISFKGAEQNNVKNVVAKLNSNNYDEQALQMEEIAKLSIETPEKLISFVTEDIFNALDNIAKKDTSKLAQPTEQQIEARKKIIVNEMVREQAKTQGQELKKEDLPYQLTEADLALAINLTSMEQAERNKEYALYTLAILAKTFTDEVQKQTGNVVPLTDLPGASTIVNSLKNNDNAGVKVAALDALRYIAKPEYKNELNSIFTLASKDENPYVARNAILALESLKENK